MANAGKAATNSLRISSTSHVVKNPTLFAGRVDAESADDGDNVDPPEAFASCSFRRASCCSRRASCSRVGRTRGAVKSDRQRACTTLFIALPPSPLISPSNPPPPLAPAPSPAADAAAFGGVGAADERDGVPGAGRLTPLVADEEEKDDKDDGPMGAAGTAAASPSERLRRHCVLGNSGGADGVDDDNDEDDAAVASLGGKEAVSTS